MTVGGQSVKTDYFETRDHRPEVRSASIIGEIYFTWIKQHAYLERWDSQLYLSFHAKWLDAKHRLFQPRTPWSVLHTIMMCIIGWWEVMVNLWMLNFSHCFALNICLVCFRGFSQIGFLRRFQSYAQILSLLFVLFFWGKSTDHNFLFICGQGPWRNSPDCDCLDGSFPMLVMLRNLHTACRVLKSDLFW